MSVGREVWIMLTRDEATILGVAGSVAAGIEHIKANHAPDAEAEWDGEPLSGGAVYRLTASGKSGRQTYWLDRVTVVGDREPAAA